jgi:hypothetical protein
MFGCVYVYVGVQSRGGVLACGASAAYVSMYEGTIRYISLRVYV